MPNKRKRNPPPISSGKRGKIAKSGAKNNFEDETIPEANSRELMYDDIDEFHSDRDKILLGSDEEDEHDKEEFEEVLPLGGESDSLSDSESERDELLDNDYYERMAKKDEIASDMEDEDDGLPDVKAWGKRKGTYYDTDYVDGDYGGFTGEDEELAQAEEKEALAIQKRLLQQINEDDFGIDWLKPVEQEKGEIEEEKVTLDLSRMSRNEKLELLKKESPEFLELVDDFQTLLKEVNDKLSPLVPYAKQGKLVKGAEYILLKHELALLYCANISFYMVLKSKGILTRNHPVIKKLAYFKKFLKELKVVDDQLSPYIESALEKLKNNEVLEASTEVPSSDAKPDKETKPKTKKLRIIAEMEEKSAQTKKVRFEDEKKPNKKRLETNDEKEALKMYQEVNDQRKKGLKSSKQELEQGSDDDDDDDDGSQSDDQEVNDVDGEEEIEQDADQELNEKRGITYQIAKNKGLMPHRKKEYRNPRVKHRIKFRKAKIRRKGQVREPRKELQRYGGETSGIRVGVKHGRKLK